jgi:hypothetical protein
MSTILSNIGMAKVLIALCVLVVLIGAGWFWMRLRASKLRDGWLDDSTPR